MRVSHCSSSEPTIRASAARSASIGALERSGSTGGTRRMPWISGSWPGSSGRSTTATDAAQRFGSANGTPASVPLQAPKL